VPEAMVIVTDVRGEVLATGKTGEQGEFGFEDLVTGTFTVAVNAPGYRPTARPVEVDGQGVTRIEIELAAGSQVRGTVLAGAGQRADSERGARRADPARSRPRHARSGRAGRGRPADADAGAGTCEKERKTDGRRRQHGRGRRCPWTYPDPRRLGGAQRRADRH